MPQKDAKGCTVKVSTRKMQYMGLGDEICFVFGSSDEGLMRFFKSE